MEMAEKTCRRCKVLKPLEAFHRNKHFADGRSSYCIECDNARNRLYFKRYTPEMLDEHRRRAREYARKRYHLYKDRYLVRQREYIKHRKTEVHASLLKLFGDHCACCGEANKDFLTLDHIRGGGNDHRKMLSGHTTRVWLDAITDDKRHEKYQLLCMNCNWGSRKDGVCPHKKQAGAAPAQMDGSSISLDASGQPAVLMYDMEGSPWP